MSNSSLVSVTMLSPNHSGKRTHEIDTITLHCVVGQFTAKRVLEIFMPTSRKASSNYVIGKDGEVGRSVDEANRSWCTSSSANDQRAITVECASDTTHPYAMNDKVYATILDLCTDICNRHGKKKLIWIADKTKALAYQPKSDEMILTVHRWFANKSCPGDWLYNRLGDVSEKVTARLGSAPSTPTKTLYRVQIGAYSVKANADIQLKKVKNAGFKNAFITQVGNLYKVQVGAFSVLANAQNMLKTVKSKGFDSFITNASGTATNTTTAPQNTTPQLKSIDEIAKEVIQGKWGSGADRKKRLTEAGYDYAKVQAKVNELLK